MNSIIVSVGIIPNIHQISMKQIKIIARPRTSTAQWSVLRVVADRHKFFFVLAKKSELVGLKGVFTIFDVQHIMLIGGMPNAPPP